MHSQNISGDRIEIRGLECRAQIGVHAFEKEEPRSLRVDMDIWSAAIAIAGQSDQLKDALDYSDLCERVRQTATRRPFQLLESLAEALAQTCLTDKRVERVRIRVSKPGAVAVADNIAVCILRPIA